MKLIPVGGDTYRNYSQDGTGHLTYYRKDLLLSFVWNGAPEHPIEIEHGGYGEILIACIHLTEADMPAGTNLSPHDWLNWFTHLCDGAITAMTSGRS